MHTEGIDVCIYVNSVLSVLLAKFPDLPNIFRIKYRIQQYCKGLWYTVQFSTSYHLSSTALCFNPNKSGIGGKSPTFVQNDFTP